MTTNEIDVNISSIDLDVFGGISNIDLNVDFGTTGQRGSRIWSGPLRPEDGLRESINQGLVLIGDYYIQTTTALTYEYIVVPGSTVPQWVFRFSITLPQASAVVDATFNVAGYAELLLPLDALNQYDTNVLASELVVRYNLQTDPTIVMGQPVLNPISSNFATQIITNPATGAQFLGIGISAIEFDATLPTPAWVPLSGAAKVHLFISYVGGGDS